MHSATSARPQRHEYYDDVHQAARTGVRHPGVVCFACKEAIFGVRHKCIDCVDLDLCDRCIALVPVRQQHDFVHTFFPIEYPWDHNPFRAASAAPFMPQRYNNCKACQRAPIVGVRYECRSCLGYTLCSACYNSVEQRAGHPLEHAFRPILSEDEGPDFMDTWDDPRAKEPSSCRPDEVYKRLSGGVCRGCDRAVEHACLDCANYGLCTACISNPEIRMAHNRAHRFAPLEWPASGTEPWPPSPPSTSGHDPDALYTDPSVLCGGCERHICSGTLHRCLECPDFTLCHSCISSVRARLGHSIRHRYFPIELSPAGKNDVFATAFASLDIVHCSGCGAKRGVVQHRCLRCPDFTLCLRCAADPKISGAHESGHPFFPYLPQVGAGDDFFEERQRRLGLKATDPGVGLPAHDHRLTRHSCASTVSVPRVFFVLSGTSICFSMDYIPWAHANVVVTIPEVVEKRILDILEDKWGSPSKHFVVADYNRAVILGLVHLVSSRLASVHDLFQSSARKGQYYTLKPPVPTTITLQQVHIGPGAIPYALADIPCTQMNAEDLLDKLNAALGTTHTLDAAELRDLLEHALRTSRDFGEAYGMLRGCWPDDGDFFLALDRMLYCQAEVQRRRDNALRGAAIQDSEIHPRRVWDLLSNRVLPFHAMLRDLYASTKKMPVALWTVSHSWVEENRRAYVVTAINGRQWPVPVPNETSLDNVRIELLNVGAEYVWLDVLCLRQVDDDIRRKEWELDIPTIGHVFQASPKDRPCITYFNGLGLPLDMSKGVCDSDRHWFQRVWTLQESLVNWLPGGLVPVSPAADEEKLFSRLDRLLSSVANWDGLPAVLRTIGERYCTTELDRVAGLARYLQCSTLPIYDRTASVEKAWTALLKHMHELPRTALFVQYAADTPFALWPSWAALLDARPVLPYSDFEMPQSDFFRYDCKLYLVDRVLLYTDRPGRYWHEGHTVGPCQVTFNAPDAPVADASGEVINLHFKVGTTKTGIQTVAIRVLARHGPFLPGIDYTLVGMGPPWVATYWVVTEVVGDQRVQRQSKRALTAMKWGVLFVDKQEGTRLAKLQPDRVTTPVVYLSGEEALTRSRHPEEYMHAFNNEDSSA